MHTMQLPPVVRRMCAALSRPASPIQPSSRLQSTLAWAQLSPHVSHAQRSQRISPTDPNDTATVLYQCTHTSPPLVVFPSPLTDDFDASTGDTAICTLGSAAPSSPHTVPFPSRTHPSACLVHIPPSSLAIVPPLMYWPADPFRTGSPPDLNELIPLASRADLGALASALATLAPQPQAVLSHLHASPLIPSVYGAGSVAWIMDRVFGRLRERVAKEMRSNKGVTVGELAGKLLGESMPDMCIRLPEDRFADAVASVVAELASEGKVRDVSSPAQPEAYQFKASHGSLGSKPRVEHVAKLDPDRVFGPGGLSMRQIMDKVKAADQQGSKASSEAKVDRGKKEDGSKTEDEERRVKSGKWVWVA